VTTFPHGLGVGIPSQTIPDPLAVALPLLQPSWWLNWGAYWAGRPGGENYFPMVWRTVDRKPDYYKRAIASTSNAWLLLNEPDMDGQANLTVGQGIQEIRKALALGITEWIGPNVCLDRRTDGWTWLDEYVVAGGPIPTAWGVHFYAVYGPNTFDKALERFKSWMVYRGVVRDIVITEVSAENASIEEQIRLLEHMKGLGIPVAWFSAEAERGYNEDLIRDGQLTELGRNYVL
jgi:hypothetical protein